MLLLLWSLFACRQVHADIPQAPSALAPSVPAAANKAEPYDHCLLSVVVSTDHRRAVLLKVVHDDSYPGKEVVVDGVPIKVSGETGYEFKVPFHHYLDGVVAMPSGIYGERHLTGQQIEMTSLDNPNHDSLVVDMDGVKGEMTLVGSNDEHCRH